MKLNRVNIYNYRSIKEETIEFDPQCRVLVGINESGKSNVLNALATLSSEVKTSAPDIRQPLPDEGKFDEEPRIRFVFDFDDADFAAIEDTINGKIVGGNDTKLLKKRSVELSIKEFIKGYLSQGLYGVNVKTGKKNAMYWTFEKKDFQVISSLKKPSTTCPTTYTFEVDDTSITLAEVKAIMPEDDWNIPAEYLSNATLDNVTTIAINAVLEYVEANLPEVVYWKYAESQLLADQVSLTSFTDDPDISIPLKHMFELAGIEDIASEINEALESGDTRLNNLLRRVAKKATDYLQEVWKDNKEVKFSLYKNGDFIQCSVNEKNDYSLVNRSDGFKKFVAFLLVVASSSHTGQLRNALLLVDEPDSGLHPAGARYLRDELIKISEFNSVVYSTHSIFMIDRHEIGRHLIVAKKNEITSLKRADEGNIVEEEVIFNAINYSVFEHLKEVNVLFEGWRDRKLFKTYTNGYKKAYFDSIGIAHSKGAKGFRGLVQTLELADRKAVIVSDNDTVAKEQQKIYVKLQHVPKWKTYKEISSTTDAITGEDFLKNNYVVAQVKQVTHDDGNELTLAATSLTADNKLAYIKSQLIQSGRQNDEALGELMNDIKTALFENLVKANIEPRYKTLIDDVQTYIEVLKAEPTE